VLAIAVIILFKSVGFCTCSFKKIKTESAPQPKAGEHPNDLN
jgi:hypothetical protein